MRLSVVFICLLVVILDVVAGLLGLKAEMAQNKEKHIRFLLFECKQPSHDAFNLGIAAASVLLIAHLITNVAGGCICFGSRQELEGSPVNKQIASACLLFSWIVLAVGFTLLIIGALSNSHSKHFCSITRHKYLWLGGILCFVHGGLSAAYYVAATAVISQDKARRIAGVSMAERGQVYN
eukprot:Gb_03050 [translate_table: standard]